MDRRTFFKWGLAGLGAFGIGRLIGRLTMTPSTITLIPVSETNKDYFRDIARGMNEDGLILKGKKVLLKPNFVEYHEGRVITTDVEVIRQVAEACFLLGAASVVVGEAAGHCVDPYFSVHNPFLKQTLDKKIRCLDMNHGEVVKIPNRGYYTRLPQFYVAAPIMQADVVINMPKLKTHHWAGVTLSMKNLFGTLPGIVYGWPKNLLHNRGIINSILDLTLSIPVHYAIVDGLVGMEGDGPIAGTAKKVGALIMGKHLLAVDATAARIMGFDPTKINYMSIAALHLPGLDPSVTTFRGEHPKKFVSRFSCLPQFESMQGENLFP